jgi:hypothetical protein
MFAGEAGLNGRFNPIRAECLKGKGLSADASLSLVDAIRASSRSRLSKMMRERRKEYRPCRTSASANVQATRTRQPHI